MVEGGGLENRFTSNRDGGSNPSPSANPYRNLLILDFISPQETNLYAVRHADEGVITVCVQVDSG